jgi:hypothetical protein
MMISCADPLNTATIPKPLKENPMALPAGTWKTIVSGVETEFVTGSPNPQGQFVGTLFGTPFSGFWDESGQRIAFTFVIGGATPETALFVGFLFRTPPNPADGQDTVATLTGTFQTTVSAPDPRFPSATARRNTFGWLAQITEVQ